MKQCVTCKETKPTERFGKRSRASDGLQSSCKDCKRAYDREYHANRSEEALERKLKTGRKWKIKNSNIVRDWIIEYFSNNPCVDCGESNPIVLEFDHRESIEKSYAIGDMINKGYSLDAVKEEVEKCEVRCANCHRIRTAHQFDWWIVKYGKNS